MDMTGEANAAIPRLINKEEAAAEEYPEFFRIANAAVEQEETSEDRQFRSEAHDRVLALYREYRPRLFAYLRSLYLTRDEAEDAIQETFLRLARKLLHRVNIETPQGWVIHVAHDLAVDVIRRRDRDADRFQEITTRNFENVQGTTPSPDETLLEKEQQQELEAALARFPAKQRQCFQMRAEGFRYKDIALALGISEQRVALIVKQVTLRLAVICG